MSIIFGAMVPHPPLIIPEVGRGQEAGIADTVAAYKEVGRKVAELAPDTIVISTPHSVMYYDYFHVSPGAFAKGDFARFGVSPSDWSMTVEYDEEFVKTLCDYADELSFPAGVAGERDASLDHATLIPLHFVREALPEGATLPKVVRIGLSGMPLSYHYMLGMLIRNAAEELGRNVVYIASGDLSHKLKDDGPYGFDAAGPQYDERIMEVMGSASFGDLFSFDGDFCDRAAECGHRSFVMMAGAFDRTAVEVQKYSHEGPFGVGSGICTYAPTGPDETRNFLEREEQAKAQKMAELRGKEDAYITLARLTLESYFEKGITPSAETLHEQGLLPELPPALLETRAGCFVSLHKDGALRGCIGTTGPTQDTLADEIIRNAVNAATEDPRFPRVEAHELPDLVYSVDVLSAPEDIDGPDDLDVRKYGVIVSTDGFIPKRGLLLPDLAGVDTVAEQIAIARRKANIRDDEKVKLQRFTVERHEVRV